MLKNIFKSKTRVCEAALLIALCLSLCVGTWAQGRQNAISASLVRLHVIAVSDEENEQEIKLKVRDAVLEFLEPLLENAADSAEARAVIEENLNGIAMSAAMSAEGRSVTVSLSRESYPTRRYTGFTLPAGEYDSLRVILGEGRGHNWWCVVFPPLCTSAAAPEELMSAMSEEEVGIVTESEGYELRFRAVELWGELTELLK